MRTSESLAKLAEALASAQGKMKCAPLNRTNPHFRSRYADLPAIRDAVMPALTEHGLAIVQAPGMDDAGNFVLITRLLHSSGEWLESSYPLPMDPGKPQALGSALTYARRYSLSAITGIAADEDDDAAEAEKQGQGPAVKPKKRANSDNWTHPSQKQETPEPPAAGLVIKIGSVPVACTSARTAAEMLMSAIDEAPDIEALTRLDHDNREFMDRLPDKHQTTFRKVIGDRAQYLIRDATSGDDEQPFDDTEEAIEDLEAARA